MRLFFGIRIPEDYWKPLQLVQERLPHVPGVRYSLTHDFHITMKFLGECDAVKILEAEVNAQGVIKRANLQPEDLELSFSRLNVMHKNGIPNVVWAAIKMSPGLYQLQQNLEDSMRDIGIRPEGQKFRPHVTLARVREFEDHALIGAWKDRYKKLGIQRKTFMVSDLELIESTLEMGKAPRYDTAKNFGLSL
jgi:2'-5' RNA ligase